MTALLELQPELTTATLVETLDQETFAATITAYFAHLNAEAYGEIARLFTPDGTLFPPFEEGVSGQAAIRQYLEAEAVGMRAFPKTMQLLDAAADAQTQVVLVRGRVELPLFRVNVAWDFCVTTTGEIQSVRVDLLASLEELVKFRR